MYSNDGKRFVNQVLAGKEVALGSHISLGLNTVYDADLNGDIAPTTHNRYHSPYIVDDIPIVNSSVISGTTADEIVFSGQANAAKRYIANNAALVVVRNGGAARQARTLANVVNTTWTSDPTPANLTRPTDTTEFTSDGVLQIVKGSVASFSDSISLYGNSVNDLIAFPVYFIDNDTTMTAAPQSGVVTLKFRYLVDGVEKYCQYSATVVNNAGSIGFDNDPSRNYNVGVGTIAKPLPLVFQRRISDTSGTSVGTTAQTMLNNGKNIIGINISYTGGTSTAMRFGSIRLTPDFDADTSRVTVAFRKLATPLHKTANEVYTNAEYRVQGVTV